MQVLNITDKLLIKKLENKIFKLERDLIEQSKAIDKQHTDYFTLMLQNERIKTENDELKKHLKALDIKISYG